MPIEESSNKERKKKWLLKSWYKIVSQSFHRAVLVLIKDVQYYGKWWNCFTGLSILPKSLVPAWKRIFSFHYTFIIICLRNKLFLETSKLFWSHAFWHCRACCYYKPTHLLFSIFLSFYLTSASLKQIILVSLADWVSNEPRIPFLVRNSLSKQWFKLFGELINQNISIILVNRTELLKLIGRNM